MVLIATAVGILSGLLANAGGFLLAPAYSRFLKLPIKKSFACSLAVPPRWRFLELRSMPTSDIYRGRSRDWLRLVRLRFPTSARESQFAPRPAGSSAHTGSSSPR